MVPAAGKCSSNPVQMDLLKSGARLRSSDGGIAVASKMLAHQNRWWQLRYEKGGLMVSWARGIPLLLVGLLSSCARSAERDASSSHLARPSLTSDEADAPLLSAASAAASTSSRESVPATFEQPAASFEIELEDGKRALAFVPAGDEKRPGLFIAHGAGGRAEYQLDYWSKILKDEFILFGIIGSPLSQREPDGGHYYENHLALRAEVLELVSHLEAKENAGERYVSRLQPRPWVYAGYSQGATMGALFLVDYGALFDRLILIEGGNEGWSLARAGTYQALGGKRILWVCGTESCFIGAKKAARVAQQAGISTEVEFVRGAGHIYFGPVGRRVVQQLPWLMN